MDEQQRVLHSPFDIETHKRTFKNYLEVIILEDGTVEYAVPSHQEKLISICMSKLNITRDQLNDMCPREYYFDFITWLNIISKAIPVWDDRYLGTANQKQINKLKVLKLNGLYKGVIK